MILLQLRKGVFRVEEHRGDVPGAVRKLRLVQRHSRVFAERRGLSLHKCTEGADLADLHLRYLFRAGEINVIPGIQLDQLLHGIHAEFLVKLRPFWSYALEIGYFHHSTEIM